jgi:hypothetical protein
LPRILERPNVREFDERPVGRGATATLVGQRALGSLAHGSRGCERQTLGLGQGHARTILVHFSQPDDGVETGRRAHDPCIGSKPEKLNGFP